MQGTQGTEPEEEGQQDSLGDLRDGMTTMRIMIIMAVKEIDSRSEESEALVKAGATSKIAEDTDAGCAQEHSHYDYSCSDASQASLLHIM